MKNIANSATFRLDNEGKKLKIEDFGKGQSPKLIKFFDPS